MLTCDATIHCSEPDCLGELDIVDSEVAYCEECRKLHTAVKWWWSSVECDHEKVDKHGHCANGDCGRLMQNSREA